MGTIIIAAVIGFIVVAIIANMIKRKRSGKSASCDCSSGCGGCGSSGCDTNHEQNHLH